MSDDRDDTRTAGLAVVFGTVALVVAGVIGYAVVRTLGHGAPAASAVAGGAPAHGAGELGAAGATLAAAAAAHGASAVADGSAGAAAAVAEAASAAVDGASAAAGKLAAAADAAASGVADAAAAAKGAVEGAASAATEVVTEAAAAAVAVGAPKSLAEGVLSGAPDGVLYFASGKAALPADASKELAKVIKAAGADPKLFVVVSGFHDSTGDAQTNAKLARARAEAVRNALLAKGLAAERVVLRKPEVTTGTGPRREARRVEMRARGA